jgi:hypothetical protein
MHALILYLRIYRLLYRYTIAVSIVRERARILRMLGDGMQPGNEPRRQLQSSRRRLLVISSSSVNLPIPIVGREQRTILSGLPYPSERQLLACGIRMSTPS